MPLAKLRGQRKQGFRGSPFSQASHGSFFPTSGWYRPPQISAVSLNVLRFFSASRASIAVASVVNARDGNRYSRREGATYTSAWDEPL